MESKGVKPKKVAVVFLFVVVVVVVVVVVFVVVVINLRQRNLLLKFCQNWVKNKQCIVVVVVMV